MPALAPWWSWADFRVISIGLQALPGIGTYTAAAIARWLRSPAAAGRRERRAGDFQALALTEPLPAVKPTIRVAAERLGQTLRLLPTQ